jgi:hypothetical protein
MRVKLELGPHLLSDDKDTIRDWTDLNGGEKAHFICGDDGDLVVAICGLLIPERDTMGGRVDMNKCKNCLAAIEKIKSTKREFTH